MNSCVGCLASYMRQLRSFRMEICSEKLAARKSAPRLADNAGDPAPGSPSFTPYMLSPYIWIVCSSQATAHFPSLLYKLLREKLLYCWLNRLLLHFSGMQPQQTVGFSCTRGLQRINQVSASFLTKICYSRSTSGRNVSGKANAVFNPVCQKAYW